MNFNIKGEIRYQTNSDNGNIYPLLNFYRENHILLHEIVDPLLHSCFEYKKLPENRASETNTQSSSIDIEDEDIVTELYSDI